MSQIGIPQGCVSIEAQVEIHPGALIVSAHTQASVNLQQLKERHRAGRCGAAYVAFQHINGRFVLTQHQEELCLLLQVNQLVNRDVSQMILTGDGRRRGFGRRLLGKLSQHVKARRCREVGV